MRRPHNTLMHTWLRWMHDRRIHMSRHRWRQRIAMARQWRTKWKRGGPGSLSVLFGGRGRSFGGFGNFGRSGLWSCFRGGRAHVCLSTWSFYVAVLSVVVVVIVRAVAIAI